MNDLLLFDPITCGSVMRAFNLKGPSTRAMSRASFWKRRGRSIASAQGHSLLIGGPMSYVLKYLLCPYRFGVDDYFNPAGLSITFTASQSLLSPTTPVRPPLVVRDQHKEAYAQSYPVPQASSNVI